MTLQCPRCQSARIKKCGFSRNKQVHQCLNCERKFIENVHHITEAQKDLVRKLLLERISLRGICRATKVSLSWLLWFMKKETSKVPDHMLAKTVVEAEKSKVVALEIDELWTFVGDKGHSKWIWLILEKETKRILASHIGPRTRESLSLLLEKVPEEIKKGLFITQIIF